MSAIRRMMMGSRKSGYGYVTDGLIFHLDGIDKGTADTSKWVDLVGGITFTEAGGTSVHGTNCINLTDTQRLVGDSMPATIAASTHTIEMAASRSTNSNWTFFFTTKSDGVALYFNSGKNLCGGLGNGTYCTTKSYYFTGNFVVSAANSVFIVDGVSEATGANAWGSRTTNYPVINSNALTSQSYSKNFDIYSVRIYNRLLTAAEMLQNQRVDNERFNLGLTI